MSLQCQKKCQYDIFLPLIFFLSYTTNRHIGVDMNEMIPIHHKIYTLCGKKIMLDSDLAELYQVDTKRLMEK